MEEGEIKQCEACKYSQELGPEECFVEREIQKLRASHIDPISFITFLYTLHRDNNCSHDLPAIRAEVNKIINKFKKKSEL